MQLDQSFELDAPIEKVWDALIDIERVAPCLPGASVTGRNEDGSYAGALTIKIGALTAAYGGKLEMENIDEGARSAVMQAQGTDKRGQGGAKATITSNLVSGEQPANAAVSTAVRLSTVGHALRFAIVFPVSSSTRTVCALAMPRSIPTRRRHPITMLSLRHASNTGPRGQLRSRRPRSQGRHAQPRLPLMCCNRLRPRRTKPLPSSGASVAEPGMAISRTGQADQHPQNPSQRHHPNQPG